MFGQKDRIVKHFLLTVNPIDLEHARTLCFEAVDDMPQENVWPFYRIRVAEDGALHPGDFELGPDPLAGAKVGQS